MAKRAETLERERCIAIGDKLASLVMRLYIAHTVYDGKAKERFAARDFSLSTWASIASAMLDAGWKPPAGWEEQA